MGIRVEIDDRNLQVELAERIAKLQDMRPLMTLIGQAMVERNRLRFDRQVSPDGERWAPTKRGGQILRKSGILFSSLLVGEVTNSSVEIGTNVPYAAALHFGTKPYVIKPRLKKALFWPGADHPVSQVNHPGLTPRPFLGINDDDQQEMFSIIGRFLEGA